MPQWGHVYYMGHFFHGPMVVFNPGCFEAEYAWEAAGALTPEIGGLISETTISEDGWSSEVVLRWLRYRPASDDYVPVSHRNVLEFEEMEPLFTLGGR